MRKVTPIVMYSRDIHNNTVRPYGFYCILSDGSRVDMSLPCLHKVFPSFNDMYDWVLDRLKGSGFYTRKHDINENCVMYDIYFIRDGMDMSRFYYYPVQDR